MAAQYFKEFVIINGELYYSGSGGVSIRALSLTKAKEKQQVHDLSYGKGDVILYRRL